MSALQVIFHNGHHQATLSQINSDAVALIAETPRPFESCFGFGLFFFHLSSMKGHGVGRLAQARTDRAPHPFSPASMRCPGRYCSVGNRKQQAIPGCVSARRSHSAMTACLQVVFAIDARLHQRSGDGDGSAVVYAPSVTSVTSEFARMRSRFYGGESHGVGSSSNNISDCLLFVCRRALPRPRCHFSLTPSP